MKTRFVLLLTLAIASFALPSAHAQNITDTGPGSFSDINNTSTLDYISVTNGATIGNVTNEGSGVIDNNNAPVITTNCCDAWVASLTVDNSTVTGGIVNNGMIIQTNTANWPVGILIANASSISGGIANNGSITMTGLNVGNVVGILLDDPATLSGNLTNAGTITATDNGGAAYGLYSAAAISGNLVNNGTIAAISTGTNSFSQGIDNSGSITGNLTNNGIVVASATDGGPSWGMVNYGSITGNQTNAGTITTTASGSGSYTYSIFNDGTIIGGITNSGTITATASDGGTVWGIYNDGAVGGDIVNTDTGAITATGDGSGAVYGIRNDIGGTVTNLTNAGTITATNGYIYSGTDTTSTYGIANQGGVSGNVTNSGTITATGNNGSPVYGIENTGTVGGDIVNSGTIMVGSNAFTNLYGIYNSGTISGGTITNTGTITAAAPTDCCGTAAYAIYNSGNALTINQNAGSITGNIQLSGNGDRLNINGGTLAGGIWGGSADQVNLTGGTLTLGGGNYGTNFVGNGLGTYTQAANGNLVFEVSTLGTGYIDANTISLGGTLVISPQGGGYLTPHTYTDVINAGTTLTGNFTAVTSSSPQYTINLVADGGSADDLQVTWSGGTGPHIADIGGGSFADSNNTGTTNYIAVTTGGTIGNITNASSGVINGNATPYVDTNCCGTYAASLSVDGTTVTGSITNSSTISQSSDANNIAGILIANASTVGGNISNNGTITLTTTGDNGISSTGISIDEPAIISGNVANAGTITITGGAGQGGIGINLDGTVSGNLTNSGMITATGGADGGGTGIFICCGGSSGVITGSIINSGTIIATNGAGGYSTGILDAGPISGSFLNSGTITAIGGSEGSADAIFFNNGITITGGVINTGTITATAGDNGNVAGIYNQNAIFDNLTNTGTITATTSGSGSTAYGIYNSNCCTASIGTITNTGTISATAAEGGTAWAILNQSTAMTIDQNAGSINGNVGLSGTDTFNINGGTVIGSIVGNQASVGVADVVNLSGGVLALPTGGGISAIGTYTQGAGGTLTLDVTPTTSATVSASNITLDGMLKVIPSGSGWVLNTANTYTDFITAGTSLSGSFASVVSSSPLFTASVTPDGSKGLDLSLTEVSPASSSPGINSFISNLLGNSNNSASAQSLANALEGMTAPQLQSAIKQLAPAQIGPELAGGGVLVGQNIQVISQHQQAMLSEPDDGTTGKAAGAPYQSGVFWGQMSGGFANRDSTSEADGYHQNYGGLSVGADDHLSEDLTVGAALGWMQGNASGLDSLAGSSLNTNSLQLTGYGTQKVGPAFINGMAGIGYNMFSQSRYIGFMNEDATSKYDGMEYMARIDGGWNFPVDTFTLTPVAGIQAIRTDNNGYTESGAGVADYSIGRQTADTVTTLLGAQATTQLPTNWGAVTPLAKVEWEHDLVQGPISTPALLGGVSFTTETPRAAPNGALVTLSATLQQSDNLSLKAEYDGDIRSDYASHTGLVKVDWNF